MLQRAAAQFERSSVQNASKWACKYRVMGKPIEGPWTFKYHAWLKEMHEADCVEAVGMKSAQGGFTEWLLNTALFRMDVFRESAAYFLPNKFPDASDFSATRFEKALDLSPHIRGMFTKSNNAGLKSTTFADLYIRGFNSPSALKSIPVPNLFYDEYDEMELDNIALSEERASGQFDKHLFKISTPTRANFGIHERYLASTQERFYFRCPHCSRFIVLEYPDNFVYIAEDMERSHIICNLCKHQIDHKTKHFLFTETGNWVAENLKVRRDDTRGFRINQLYSATVSPLEFARAISRAANDEFYEQELFNSKLGLPYTAKGSQVNDDDLNNCMTSDRQIHTPVTNYNLIRTLGIDVGKHFHFIVLEWAFAPDFDLSKITSARVDYNNVCVPKLIRAGKTTDVKVLSEAMRTYQINHAVMDMNPEQRTARAFADEFPAHVNLCYYIYGNTGRVITKGKSDSPITGEYQINAHRTVWVDTALSRFKSKRILLPCDLDKEFKDHIKAPSRRYKKDRHGQVIATYDANSADHYAHALTYAEIALPLALGYKPSQDIRE